MTCRTRSQYARPPAAGCSHGCRSWRPRKLRVTEPTVGSSPTHGIERPAQAVPQKREPPAEVQLPRAGKSRSSRELDRPSGLRDELRERLHDSPPLESAAHVGRVLARRFECACHREGRRAPQPTRGRPRPAAMLRDLPRARDRRARRPPSSRSEGPPRDSRPGACGTRSASPTSRSAPRRRCRSRPATHPAPRRAPNRR